jgi:hypothetical protein
MPASHGEGDVRAKTGEKLDGQNKVANSSTYNEKSARIPTAGQNDRLSAAENSGVYG